MILSRKTEVHFIKIQQKKPQILPASEKWRLKPGILDILKARKVKN
ncbi:hypothetical protein B4096_3421 [Heyndrickxia coagulans]|uniref:Uncharacterized protein n=1 Tax=Heyndrickxia coagulans TaxID=1398 RepID=A0A150JXI3_HEYCO|nr:hypothetical protein HMPREF3213_03663 [Heyndrickxia coagulans]KYC59032.1 hypothetical protein B4100_3533 [Heyndrickxia coagulans]KYC61942.1 hypothetical protein B4098_3275 [Heyndrickxia coagulans]KYC88441.1 hypothetical protein B4096_3421 [Heyndrickxia coagulans]